jgi:hypothetical protein
MENMLLEPHSCGRLVKVHPAAVTYIQCARRHCAPTLHLLQPPLSWYKCRRDLQCVWWTELPSSLFHYFSSNAKNKYRSMYRCAVTFGLSYIQFSITGGDCWKKFNRLSRKFYYFSIVLRPNASHGLLILEVSKSHTATYHSWQDSSGRVITSSQSSLSLYLTKHNNHNRQTPMSPSGFEPKISAGERPQTYALDRAVARFDLSCITCLNQRLCLHITITTTSSVIHRDPQSWQRSSQ